MRAAIVMHLFEFTYEELAFHIYDSRSLRRFCRIGIDDKGRVKMSRQAALEERGEQHIDDALREKAAAKREERSNKGSNSSVASTQ